MTQQAQIEMLPQPDESVEIPAEKLLPSRYQMRDEAYEREEDLKELANAIAKIGLTQFPKARPHPEKAGYFELITGHRRKEAVTRILKWKTIKCDVYKNLPETTVLYIVGEDNLARRNIYPYEKGKYFRIWHDKLEVDKIAELFGVTPQAIYSWLELADAIDRLVEPMDPETKKRFIKNVTKDKIDELLKVESDSDLYEACVKVANGIQLKDLQEFVQASLNASQRLGKRDNSQGKPSDREDPIRELVSAVNKAGKARSYEEAMQHIKTIKEIAQPTLDKFFELEETIQDIQNAKNRAVIHVKKAGALKVIHKVDEKGNGLCIHEQKDGKRIIARFKIDA